MPDETKQSTYSKGFSQLKELDRKPQFLAPGKDCKIIELNGENRLFHTENPLNTIYSLEIHYRIGEANSHGLEIATELINYCGTADKRISPP